MGGSRLRHTHKELLVLVHIVVLKKLNIVSVFALFGLFFLVKLLMPLHLNKEKLRKINPPKDNFSNINCSDDTKTFSATHGKQKLDLKQFMHLGHSAVVLSCAPKAEHGAEVIGNNYQRK